MSDGQMVHDLCSIVFTEDEDNFFESGWADIWDLWRYYFGGEEYQRDRAMIARMFNLPFVESDYTPEQLEFLKSIGEAK